MSGFILRETRRTNQGKNCWRKLPFRNSQDSEEEVRAADVEDEDEFIYDITEIGDTRKTILKQRAHKRNNAKIVFAG